MKACSLAAGVVLSFVLSTSAQSFRVLYDFSGSPISAQAQGQLILDGDTLYGTTSADGNAGNGTVFSAKPTARIIKS